MKIKIVKSIPLQEEFETENYYMPSLSLSRIYTYLKNKGFDIVQQDLFKKHDNRNFHFYSQMRRMASYYYDHSERLFGRSLSTPVVKLVSYYISKRDLADVDVLLVSVYDCSYYSSVFGIIVAKYFKSIHPNGVVVLGGEWLQNPYALKNFGELLRNKILDYYVLNAGERALELLLTKLKADDHDFTNVPGLCYLKDGKIEKNTFTSRDRVFPVDFSGVDLTQYYWTKAHIFTRMNPRKFANKALLMLPVQHLTGCVNRCAFCGYSAVKCVSMSPMECVDNIERLYDTHGVRFFFFLDTLINISKNFITAFCNEITQRNLDIYWSSCASFKGLDSPEMFHMLRNAGACRLIYGLETASPRLLEYVNKRVDIDQVEHSVRWSHEAGIWTDLELIAGLPTETDEDLQCTVDFLNRNSGYISHVWLNRFFLTVGSDMFTHPERFSITNIRSMDGELMDINNKDYRYQYLFDEIGGLKWEDKVHQIENAFLSVKGVLEAHNLSYPYERNDFISALFYLYSSLENPQEIKAYFDMYTKEAFGNAV